MTRWSRMLARPFAWVAAGWIAMAPAPARAQEGEAYVVGVDDILSVSVWLRPELERQVTVNSEGNIVFPPVGEVKAAGLTLRQLSERLGDRLSAYLRQTSTVTVTVVQYMSRSVLVVGAVTTPGRFGFERVPGLLEVIARAGGTLPEADLGRVQILRRDGPQLRALTADVAEAMLRGSEAGLPSLEPGDVVVISTGAAGVRPDAVGVLGEVNRPGLYPVGDGQDIWMVLAQAGGPTGAGDLSRIRVLSPHQTPGQAAKLNLLENLERGKRSTHVVRPGDIVYLNPKRANLWTGFTGLLAVTRDVLNLVLLTQVLRER